MISNIDSYGFMHQIPRVRQFSEPDFMPWNNGWDPLINYSVQLDPTFDWGFRPATEPYQGQVVVDPQPVSCMKLCREAIKQFEGEFCLDDICNLLSESGYSKELIRNCSSQLARKMGLKSIKMDDGDTLYFVQSDYQI